MLMWYTRMLVMLGFVLVLGSASQAQTDETLSPTPPAAATRTETQLTVFDEIWQTVRDHFYDPSLRSLDWPAVGEKYRPLAAAAADEERSGVFNRMLAELAASHTVHYTSADPAYYQLLVVFSSALRRGLRPTCPNGQVTDPGIGIFTRRSGDKTFISAGLDGLSAAKARLQVGAELLAADGSPYHPTRSFATKVNQAVTLQV